MIVVSGLIWILVLLQASGKKKARVFSRYNKHTDVLLAIMPLRFMPEKHSQSSVVNRSLPVHNVAQHF
jgi:hypothetical protein